MYIIHMFYIIQKDVGIEQCCWDGDKELFITMNGMHLFKEGMIRQQNEQVDQKEM